MKILYFAWVRQKLGKASEDVSPPPEVTTAGELLAWLRGLDEAHAEALADTGALRIAIDQQHADMDTPVTNAKEAAFFPPVTGG